jgi:hypothetical protein
VRKLHAGQEARLFPELREFTPGMGVMAADFDKAPVRPGHCDEEVRPPRWAQWVSECLDASAFLGVPDPKRLRDPSGLWTPRRAC